MDALQFRDSFKADQRGWCRRRFAAQANQQVSAAGHPSGVRVLALQFQRIDQGFWRKETAHKLDPQLLVGRRCVFS